MEKKEIFNALIEAKARFVSTYNAPAYVRKDTMFRVLSCVYYAICVNHNLDPGDYNDEVAGLFYDHLGTIGADFIDLHL